MLLLAEAIELTDSTRFTLSVSAIVAIVAVVTAWVTLRMRVEHLEKRHEHDDRRHNLHEKASERIDRRVSSLERWRERSRGAAAVRRDDTDRILIPTSAAGSAPYHRDEDD